MIVWLVDLIFKLAMLAILARLVLSLIGFGNRPGFGRIITGVTDLIIRPFRNRVNVRGMNADFGPVLAFIALIVVRWVVIRIING